MNCIFENLNMIENSCWVASELTYFIGPLKFQTLYEFNTYIKFGTHVS